MRCAFLWSKVVVTLSAKMAAKFELTIFGIMRCATLMEQGCCYFGDQNGRKVLTHVFGIIRCAILMEQGCCFFGSRSGRKVLIHHLWIHALRSSYGARLLLCWQQARLQILNSPSLESCAAQLLWSKVVVTSAAKTAAKF